MGFRDLDGSFLVRIRRYFTTTHNGAKMVITSEQWRASGKLILKVMLAASGDSLLMDQERIMNPASLQAAGGSDPKIEEVDPILRPQARLQIPVADGRPRQRPSSQCPAPTARTYSPKY
jgi:hypothetical protein